MLNSKSRFIKLRIEDFNMTDELLSLCELLSSIEGSSYWLAGGCVRDIYTKKQVSDYDFIFMGKSLEELQSILKEKGLSSRIASSKAGAIEITIGDTSFDIACRQDKVGVMTTIGQYDFTINALLLDVETGNIIDPYNGIADITAGIIRSIKNPVYHFTEHPTNILRAIYLISKLNFRLSDEDLEAIYKSDNNLSIEDYAESIRIIRLISNIFSGSNREKAIRLLNEFGLLEQIFPSLSEQIGSEQFDFTGLDLFSEFLPYDKNSNENMLLTFIYALKDSTENDLRNIRFYGERNQHPGRRLIKSGLDILNSYRANRNLTLLKEKLKSVPLITRYQFADSLLSTVILTVAIEDSKHFTASEQRKSYVQHTYESVFFSAANTAPSTAEIAL